MLRRDSSEDVGFGSLETHLKSRKYCWNSNKYVNSAKHLNTITNNSMRVFFVIALSLVACFQPTDHDVQENEGEK